MIKRSLLWLLLVAAMATRWPWPPKWLLLAAAVALWSGLTWLVLPAALRWRALPALLLLGVLILPAGWLAVPDWPILWQLFGATATVGVLLAVANLIASRYATTIDG